MKLTYFGTAAAEGFPAVFCRCEHCIKARALGGKNIRTRSQALVDDALLIDFPADSYAHFLANGIEADAIHYLLITHSHSDHLYVEDLIARHAPYAHSMRAPTLEIFGSSVTCDKLAAATKGVCVTPLTPFETVTVGTYRVTPLPARHMPGGEALIYLIEGDKTLLYAHDTGYFYDEVFSYLERTGTVLDMISLDCTNVDIPIDDEGHHMGFRNNERVLSRLREIGAVTDRTVCYVNHFSHNGAPLHDALCERAARLGCQVSYDGCVVTF